MDCSIFHSKNEHEHIQKKTFTKWINSVLAKRDRGYQIRNIFLDLCDGIKLLEIMEILTHSRLIIERKSEMQRVHCFANMATLLRFLTAKHKIKLVNINISDIVDGRPNIVLGLIWQIILNFQIRNDEKFQSIAMKDNDPVRRHSLVRGTPKEALLAWLDKILSEHYGLDIQDFNVSWRSGVAFNAIIHYIKPDLIDLDLIGRRTAKENLEIAFKTAEKYLNIPALLEPEDVDVEYPDEKSIMTYVAQFLQHYSDLDNRKKLSQKFNMAHDCNDQNFSNTLTLSSNLTDSSTVRDGLANQKSSYTRLELSKSSKHPVFEANISMNLKLSDKKSKISHQIKPIKHDHLTEDEEQQALNDECNRLLGHIKTLLSEIDVCIKGNSMKSANSIKEEMKIFLPIMEKIGELKNLQENVENIITNNPSATNAPKNQLKFIDKDFKDRLSDMQKWQWKIEKLVPGKDSISILFDCMHHCEEGESFVSYISLKLILDIEFSFVEKVKAAILKFPQIKDTTDFSESAYGLPDSYLNMCKERIIAIEENLPRLSAFFEFISIFKELNNEIWTQQERVKECMSGFGNFDILYSKYDTLKDIIQTSQTDRLKASSKVLSAAASSLTNTHLSKKISTQMVISQCTQKIKDDLTKLLRDSDQTLELHKSLLQKWQILNEKRDKLKDWIELAHDMARQPLVERDRFLAPENNCDKIYQDYHKEKIDFPKIDDIASLFIEDECNALTTKWNEILTKFENLRQQEQIDDLKKEYLDRIQRIEKWLDKSETIVEKRVSCREAEVSEYIAILEAAAMNFDTVKNDLQRVVKVGEAMYKSNMSEEEVEEVLGTLNVNKERFINIRDKINSKIKKMKKLISVSNIFDRNLGEINSWIDSVQRLFHRFEQGDNLSDEQFFQEWMEEYETLFNPTKLKEIQDRKSENLKILERIKDKLEDDVNISDCDMVLKQISDSINKIVVKSKGKKNHCKFKHTHERFKNLLYSIEDQIEEEESQMNSDYDFTKILDNHELFFGNENKKAHCYDLINELIKIKDNFEGPDHTDDINEFTNIIEQLRNSCENTFSKVTGVKESLITLPKKLEDMKIKMSGIEQWIQSLKSLTVKLDMSGDNMDSVRDSSKMPSSEEYKATLTEFEQLSNLSNTNRNMGEELQEFLAEISTSRPGIQLKDEEMKILELRRCCQEMQPQIDKVLHTAPVIAKSIELREEMSKRNEQLLQLKNNLENIPEEEDCEEIEDIYVIEQKMMSSLDQERPEIMQEIAEFKELQMNSETSKIMSSSPVDLERTYQILNEVVRKRLKKLRETKEALENVEDVMKALESDLQDVENDTDNVNDDIGDVDTFERVNRQYEELFKCLDEKMLENIQLLQSTIDNEKAKFSNKKYQELIGKKDVFLDRIKKNKNNISKKFDELLKIRQLLIRFEETKANFQRFHNDVTNKNDVIKRELQSVINEDRVLNDLIKLKDRIENTLTNQEKEYCEIIKEIPNGQTKMEKLINDTIAKECELCEFVVRDIEILEKRVQVYQNALYNLNEMEVEINNELKDINEMIREAEPLQMDYTQWKSCKSESVVRPITVQLNHCIQKINTEFKNMIERLDPKLVEFDNRFENVLQHAESQREHVSEIRTMLDEGVAFLKRNKDSNNTIQKRMNTLNESLNKVTKNRHLSTEDKIESIIEIRGNIDQIRKECNELVEDIERENCIFNKSVIEEIVSVVNGFEEHLIRELGNCDDLVAEESQILKTRDDFSRRIDELDSELDDVENQIKAGRIMFGDNKDERDAISTNLFGLRKLKEQLDDVVTTIDRESQASKRQSFENVFDKIKYCKAKLAVIEKEADERLTFLDWIGEFREEYENVSRDVENGNYELADLNSKKIDDFSRHLKVTKSKIDTMKSMVKSRKKVFKIVSSDNCQNINLQEVLAELDAKFGDLIKEFEKEKKDLVTLKEQWKDFEKKKKNVTDSLINAEKLLNDIEPKVCEMTTLNLVEKELFKLENLLKNLDPSLSSLLDLCQTLYDKKPAQAQFTKDVIEKDIETLEHLLSVTTRKLEATKRIANHCQECNKTCSNIRDLLKSLNSKLKCETKFIDCNTMLEYFRHLNDEFQDSYGELEKKCDHLRDCISNIEQDTKYFPEFSCKSLVSNEEKFKSETENMVALSKTILKDISVELERLKDITSKVRFLQCEIDDFMESLNTLTGSNRTVTLVENEIDNKTERLKSLRENQKRISDVLKEKSMFLNLESFIAENNEIIKVFDKAGEIIKRLRETMTIVTREKENLSKKLNAGKEKFSKIKEEIRTIGYLNNKSDKKQLDKIARLNSVLGDLLQEIKGYEDQFNDLLKHSADRDLEKMKAEFQNFHGQITGCNNEISLIKEQITTQIKEDYDKAKREHEQWMREVESKVRGTDAVGNGQPKDVQSQLASLNELIAALSEGEKRTAEVITASSRFYEAQAPSQTSEVINDKYVDRELESRFNEMVASILEQKKLLEELNNASNQQKDLISDISNRLAVNEKRLSTAIRDNFTTVDQKRKRIIDIENIERDTYQGLMKLIETEPHVQDLLIKESILSQICSHQEFQKLIHDEKIMMIKNLEFHERIQMDLREMNIEIKDRMTDLNTSICVNPLIDQNYLNKLKHDIKKLSGFVKECIHFKVNCDDKCRDLIKDSSNPDDLNTLLSSFQTNFNILNKKLDKLNEEWRSANELFSDWSNTFANVKESLEKMARLMNEEIFPNDDIEGKEIQLERCLGNTQCFNDLRTSMRNLEKLTQSLNNPLFVTELTQLKNHHKDLQTRNNTTYSQMQKSLQKHKEYATKISDITRRVEAVNTDQNDPINGDSTKYILATLKRNLDQAQELENELKRLEDSRNYVCSESSRSGRDLLNAENSEILLKIKTKKQLLHERIERLTNESIKLDGYCKKVSSLGNWIKSTKKMIQVDQWSMDLDAIKLKMNEMKMLNAEARRKYEEIQEIKDVLMPMTIDTSDVIHVLNEYEGAIEDIDNVTKQIIQEGEGVKKCLQNAKEIDDRIKRKHDLLKSELNLTHSLSNPNNLQNEIQKTNSMLQSIQEFKPLQCDLQAVVVMLPKTKAVDQIERYISLSVEKCAKEWHDVEDQVISRQKVIELKCEMFEEFKEKLTASTAFMDNVLAMYYSIDKTLCQEEKLLIEEELMAKIIDKSQHINQLVSLAEGSGFDICKDNSRLLSTKFSKLLDDLTENISTSQKEISMINNYKTSINTIERQIEMAESVMADLRTINFTQVCDISNSKVRALDIRRQSAGIESTICSLEQEFGARIKQSTLNQKSVTPISDLKRRLYDINRESNVYVQKCDSELGFQSEYDDTNKCLQDSLIRLRNAVINVEKSGDLLPEQFEKIKQIKPEIIENEMVLDKLNSIMKQSNLLSRSLKVNNDMIKSQKDLCEIKVKFDQLKSLAEKDILTRDKYAAIEHFFNEQLGLALDKLEAVERHHQNETKITELNTLSDKLHHSYDELTAIINDEIDHHSDRYLEFTRDHRNRLNHLNNIDSKVHNYTFRLNQQKEHQARCDQRKSSVESKVRNTELQLESIQMPKDIVQLQNNIVLLRSVIHEIGVTETEIQSLFSDVTDSPQMEQSCRQLQNRNMSIKAKAEKTMRDTKNAEIILKEHKHSMNVANDFLQQCQKKYETLSTKLTNIHQLENEFQKNSDLLLSIEKNRHLIVQCSPSDIAQLHPMSDLGVEIIKQDIKLINKIFDDLENSCQKLRNVLAEIIDKKKQENNTFEDILVWLKRQEKELKSFEHADDEESLKKDLEWLKKLRDDLLSKQGNIDILSQKQTSSSKYVKIKEKFDSLLENTKKALANNEIIRTNYLTFFKLFAEWSQWYETIKSERISLSTKHDENRRNTIRTMLDEKDKKYGDMINLTTKGEVLVHQLSVSGGNRIKGIIKSVKDQWHEIFDGLTIMLDNLEERIENKTALKDILERTQTQFDRCRTTFYEEIQEDNPLRIEFHLGIENKEKQLHKLETIMQTIAGMSYTVQKLETGAQSEDDSELEYEIGTLVIKFRTFSDLVYRAKELSAESFKNHVRFEESCLQTTETIETLKSRLMLCESVNGTSMSLQSRIDRIQTILAKDLINSDTNDDRIFNQLISHKERTETFMNDIEKGIINERVNFILEDRKVTQHQMQLIRENLEKSFNNIEEFKTEHDNLTKDIGIIRQKLHNNSEFDLKTLDKLSESIKEITLRWLKIEELSVEILRGTNNELPLDMSKNLQKQIEEITSDNRHAINNVGNRSQVQEQLDETMIEFRGIIKHIRNTVDSLTDKWNAATSRDECLKIFKEINELSTDSSKGDIFKEDLERIIPRFNDFPIRQKKNSAQVSILIKDFDSALLELNGKKSIFECTLDEFKAVDDKIKNLQDELKLYSTLTTQSLPETKLEKFNLINDLNSQLEYLKIVKSKIDDINTKSINNQNLSVNLSSDKVEMLKVAHKNIDVITKHIKLLSTSLNDQDQLGIELATIKECVYCIESAKLSLTAQSKLNGEILESKIVETDKNIILISSLKKQIDQNLIQNRVGCYPELEELKKLRKNVEKIEAEFKILKSKFNADTKKVLSIEDDVRKFDKFLQLTQDELKGVSEYGNSYESKKALLNKANDIQHRIFEEDEQVNELNKLIIEIECICEGAPNIEKMFIKLTKQFDLIKERVTMVITKHEQSIIDFERFDEIFKQVSDELVEMKGKFQHLEFKNIKDDIPDIKSLKISLEQLHRLGENCARSSSEEGKNSVNRRLEEAKKKWKNVEQLQKEAKANLEKENIQVMEKENQKSQFKARLEDIKERQNKLKADVVNDVNGKRKKHIDSKSILEDIQEWKKDINQYFESGKETKNSELEIEMLKDYRSLLFSINNEISDSKLALKIHMEYDKNVEDCIRWLDGIENQISEFYPQLQMNLEEIDRQIRKFHDLTAKINNENTIVTIVKNSLKNLAPYTSKEGQVKNLETLAQMEERYEIVREELKKSVQKSETCKRQLVEFETSLNKFEYWLKETEENFTSRTLLTTLSDKERKLKTCQHQLLCIYNKKEILEELSKELKELPINLTLTHNLRGLQTRYSSLTSLAQSQVDQLAKWEATHHSYVRILGEFGKETGIVSNMMDKLNDNVQSNENIDGLLSVVHEIENKFSKIEEVKIELENIFHNVVQETNSSGHEEINKQYFKEIKNYSEFLNLFNCIKTTVNKRHAQENRGTIFADNLEEWICNVKRTINDEWSPGIQISAIKNNLSLLDNSLQDVSRKICLLSETKKDNMDIKDSVIIKRFFEIDKELQNVCKDFKERKSHTEHLLESFETYKNSCERIGQWIDESSLRIKSISVQYGSEMEINDRLNSINNIRSSFSTKGTTLLDATIDSANTFMKCISEKSDKEKILAEIDKVEQDFSDLTQRSEQIEDKLTVVSQQWKKYRKNVDDLTNFIIKSQKKKQQLLDLQHNYGSDMEGCIEKLLELIGEISNEKIKLEMTLSQTNSLKDISQDPQIDIVVQDGVYQLNEQEIDCKYQLDRIRQLKNVKVLFDEQYLQTIEWIQNMKTTIIVLDQLHDVPSFLEFQRHFSNFQLLEAKFIAGDRIVDDCYQSSHRLLSLCDNDKEVEEMMKMTQKSWTNLKEKFSDIKSRLTKLMDIWSTLDHLYSIVDDWIIKTNKTVDLMMETGYISEDLKDKTLQNIKELNSSAESIKPKLSKISELYHRAESYSAFTKRGDPLVLQKRFCESLETMKVFEKQLQYTQNNIDRFYQDVSELGKIIIDTSLTITNKCQTTDTINSIEEINNQLKFSQDLSLQITNYEQDNMVMLIKLKDTINKQLRNQCTVTADINSKISILTDSLKQIKTVNDKWKESLKQRCKKIRQYQTALDKAEQLIYTEFPDWWNLNEVTTTTNPDDCLDQIRKSEIILENISSLESELQHVWLDYTHQRQLLKKSQSVHISPVDYVFGNSLKQLPDNHLDQIKRKLQDSMDRVSKKLNELHKHKEKWLQIDNDIDELNMLFSKTYFGIEQMIKNQPDNDVLYEQFEDSVLKILSNRQILERLHEDINELNGYHDTRGSHGNKPYGKYVELCQDYSAILRKIENLRNNLFSFKIRNAVDGILQSDTPSKSSQKRYPQSGTQTPRNKLTSIRTLKRYQSNPNLNDPLLSSHIQSVDNLRKSVDTGIMTQAESFSKRMQTVNDVGIQSKKKRVSLSEYADKVMRDKHSFDKRENSILEQSNDRIKRKEDRLRRLGDLISTIQTIKDDVSSLHSKTNVSRQKSPTRSSVESIRHNILPTNTKTKPVRKRSKSKESMSKTWCVSPTTMIAEKPRKRTKSPRKSLSKFSPTRHIAF